MELHRVEIARKVGGDGEGRVGRGAVNLEARGELGHMVAMAHPDLLPLRPEPALQEIGARARGCDIGAPEFGGAVAAFNLSAQHMHHHLLAVADAQHRDAQRKHRFRRHRRAVGEDRGRAAGQDHRPWREVRQEGVRHLVERMDFAIDVQLAQATRDKLRHLAAEVDDEKALMIGHGRWNRAGRGVAQVVSGRAAFAHWPFGPTCKRRCRFRVGSDAIGPGCRQGTDNKGNDAGTGKRGWT